MPYRPILPPIPQTSFQEQIGSFAPQDFVYQMGGPEPTEIINGVQIRPTTVAQMPSLEGQGAGMLLINFAPCSVNLAHVHPRATEVCHECLLIDNSLCLMFLAVSFLPHSFVLGLRTLT